ncbi:MAG: hypothetical protein C0601_05005 [Candidatus Muiribacterium halophilum]|uniref:Uncharacterized protein n=1 Tax=Muiribacterium halophilum TaxID=2053465 RepID=A0A2N5ZI61_MUIH1|nr:MAG: hypothetical protein C0601_05005 [Candidatus Muirbacterium halophilum]
MKVFYRCMLIFILILSFQTTVFSIDLDYGDSAYYRVSDKLFSETDVKTLIENDKQGKIDVLEHYLQIATIRNVAYFNMINNVRDDHGKEKLNKQIDMLDEYRDKLAEILVDKENSYKNMFDLARRLNRMQIDPNTYDAFLYYPLIESFSSAYKLINFFYKESSLDKMLMLQREIKKNIDKGLYQRLFKQKDYKPEDLIAVSAIGTKSVKLIYFDPDTMQLVKRNAFPGTIIGKFKVRAIYDDSLVLFNLETKKSIVRKFKTDFGKDADAEVAFNDIKKNYKVVPWFGEDYVVNAKRGGTVTLYVKVIDEQGMTLKSVSLNVDGLRYDSDSNGMIKITMDPSMFSSTENTFTVAMNDNVKADFTVKIAPRDMMVNYSASAGLKVGVGLEPVLAGASVGVKPACDGSVTFISPYINRRSKDAVLVTVFPTLTWSFSASLGPKLKPLDVHVLSHNLGVGAGATVGFNASQTLGFTQKYRFLKPYTSDRKAETVLMMDKLLTVSGAFKPILSAGLKKISGVDVKDYQIYSSLSLTGSVGVSGNIGGTLGLVKTDENGKISETTAGISGSLVSGSANINTGIEGGLINGYTVFGPTDYKYNVVLKAGASGSFSALDVSSKIFGHDIIPEWFLVNANGNIGSNLIFRFDKDFRLTSSIVVFTAGYKFKNNIYNRTIQYLKERLKEDDANPSDYSELYDISGMTKIYIFVIDREKTEKYFGEWASFSRTLLTQRDQQSEQTVVANIKGLFGVLQQSFKKIVETPVLLIEKTDILLKYYTPSIGINVSAGIKINLGVETTFTKSKSYVDRIAYFSGFKVYNVEELGYTKDIARTDREITYLMNSVKNYVVDEIKDGAGYVFKKAKDGTIYVAQKLQDGAVYVITVAADGTVHAAKKVGQAAKNTWNFVVDNVGSAAEYVYEQSSNFASSVGNALSTAWNYWF